MIHGPYIWLEIEYPSYQIINDKAKKWKVTRGFPLFVLYFTVDLYRFWVSANSIKSAAATNRTYQIQKQ